MRDREIHILKESFNKVLAVKDNFVKLFYQNLFQLDPGLEKLSLPDTSTMEEELMKALKLLVNGLEQYHDTVPIAQELAVATHLPYGVTADVYDISNIALIRTLETILGNDFTPEVKAAWIDSMSRLARVMKEAAMNVSQQPLKKAL